MPGVKKHSKKLMAIKGVQGPGLPEFDVMLEAKAKDLAVLHLREQLGHLVPALRLE